MTAIFPKWANKLTSLIITGIVVTPVVVIGLVWYYFSPKYTDVGYQPVQPVPFSHQLHAGQLGMDCRYCHSTVEKAAFAAIPPTQTCMGCHSTILKDSPKLAPVRESFATGKPIPWIKVHMLPDYAHFDHSAHLGAGVGCVSCHGRIDHMKTVQQSQPLNMAWCLECHRDPKPNLRPLSEITNMNWDPVKSHYNPDTDSELKRSVSPPKHCSGCHH